MTEYTQKKGDNKFICDIDIKSKEATCVLEKKWGDYGFHKVAAQTYDLSKLLDGENKLPAIGKPEGENPKEVDRLHDFVRYFVPQMMKAEKSREYQG